MKGTHKLDPKVVAGVLQAYQTGKPVPRLVGGGRKSLADLARDLFPVQQMPSGAVPIYDKDPEVEAVTVTFGGRNRFRGPCGLRGFNPLW